MLLVLHQKVVRNASTFFEFPFIPLYAQVGMLLVLHQKIHALEAIAMGDMGVGGAVRALVVAHTVSRWSALPLIYCCHYLQVRRLLPLTVCCVSFSMRGDGTWASTKEKQAALTHEGRNGF